MTQQGAGAVRFWGFSPALDLFSEAAAASEVAEEVADSGNDSPLRALLVAPGDVRHVLRSVAAESRRAHEAGTPERPAEYFLYEREPEVLARHMLLLAIALDFELPRRERAEVLLEVWANSLLREKTAAYVASRATVLRRVLLDDDGPLAPLIDVSGLKSSQRDELDLVLCSWAENVEFEAVKLRDERLRALYKSRYDHRVNVLDWDYTMELLPIASIVHKIHWREWRQTGIAYEVRDSSYVAPNRTLASMVYGRQAGASVMRRGFWGDVANGPWAATGVTCDEPRLTNKKSDRHHKSSCDIAYYNVLGWLSEMENGVPFGLKQEDIEAFEYGGSVASGGLAKGFLDAGGKAQRSSLEAVVEEGSWEDGPRIEETPPNEEEAAEETRRAEQVRARVAAAKMAKIPPFKIRLLGGDWVDVQRKPRHQHLFDVMVIATHVAFVMGSERLNGLLRPVATTLVETAKFLVEIRRENRQEYAQKLAMVARRLGWVPRKGLAVDGIAHAEIAFTYDESKAKELAESVAAEEKAAGTVQADGDTPQLLGNSEDGQLDVEQRAEGVRDSPPATAEALQSLKIVEGDAPQPPSADVEGKPPPPLPTVSLSGEKKADLAVSGGKVCFITGRPAKYRDPISGLPYADLAAFKELRKLHPDPRKPVPTDEAQESQEGEQAAQGGDEDKKAEENTLVDRNVERPIVISNGFTRRINKIA
jgi:dynein assembly factor 3